MSPPVIFISYSHDSVRHRERVQRFAERLRVEAGCDVRIDIAAEPTVAQWPRWMRRQIKEADTVLMVFTKVYRKRFDGDEKPGRGRGVTWESTIIENTLYAAAAGPAALKFVPIALDPRDSNHVPREVFSGTIYELPGDWERLLACLRAREVRKSVRSPQPVAVTHQMGAKSGVSAFSVLFVGAEKGTGLDLRGQLAQTRAAIARAKFGQSMKLTGVFNLTPDEMLMELNKRCPDVLHLSGKQDRGQVKMHDAHGQLTAVSADRLAALLRAYPALRLVILDTCWSLPQARRVVQKVDAAVGVAAAIAEPVATDFFAMFFNALASGTSVKRAHRLAFDLQLAKIEGDTRYRREVEAILETPFAAQKHLPRLVGRRGIDLNRVFLAGPLAS